MKLKEVDLFDPVKRFLLNEVGCSDVYGEVQGCDVLGLKGLTNVVVELKTSLSFHLLDQAIDRLAVGHYVYIAVPKRKRSIPKSARMVLEANKIGYIEVEFDDYLGRLVAKVVIPARYNRLAADRYLRGYNTIRDRIEDFHGEQRGGVPSGESVTVYSVTIDRIKVFLRTGRRRGQWVSIDQILEHCETHYADPKPSVMATLQAEWNQDWCESKMVDRVRMFRGFGEGLG